MNTKIFKNISLFLIFVTPFIVLISPSDPGAQLANNSILFFTNHLFFPFITGKAFVFRICTEIIFSLWLILMLFDKKYAPRFSKLSLTLTIFTVVIFIADVLGVNPLRSLWSNNERMEGWVTIVHLWAYFVALTAIFGSDGEDSSKRMWHRFFKVNLFAAFLVGMYGVSQLAGKADIHQGSSRIDASLGNAEYMAVYMLVYSFIAFYMSYVERARRKMGLSWMYIVLGLFFAFLLFETATRGSILGMVAGILTILGMYVFFGKGQSKRSRWVSGGIIVAMLVLGILFYANKNASFIQNDETLRRLSEISIHETQTQARAYIWPAAIKGAFSSPKTALIGWGQENFNYIFNANYNPKMWSQEQWFDRAHSVFLDWLVAGGLIGLILYISLFVLAGVSIWKSDLTFAEKAILLGLLAAYTVHTIFVFDNLISYLCFFLILGFSHSLSAGSPISRLERKDEQTENSIVVRDYLLIPFVVIILGATLYFVNVRPIEASVNLIYALNACSGQNPSADYFTKALSYGQSVANQEIREQLINCASNVSRGSVTPDLKTAFLNLTKKEIDEQVKASSKDARIYVLGGGYYNNLGDWANAKPLLEKAHELSPNKQTITFELATNYLNSGREKDAATLLKKAYEDAPENPTAAIAYASTLVLIGQEAEARKIFGNNEDIFTDQRMVNVYIKLKQYQKVIDIEKILISKSPENINLYGALVSAYLLNGQKTEAITELKAIAVKFPQSKAQVDETIKQILAGKDVLHQ